MRDFEVIAEARIFKPSFSRSDEGYIVRWEGEEK
jgi:hypothetical protein